MAGIGGDRGREGRGVWGFPAPRARLSDARREGRFQPLSALAHRRRDKITKRQAGESCVPLRPPRAMQVYRVVSLTNAPSDYRAKVAIRKRAMVMSALKRGERRDTTATVFEQYDHDNEHGEEARMSLGVCL